MPNLVLQALCNNVLYPAVASAPKVGAYLPSSCLNLLSSANAQGVYGAITSAFYGASNASQAGLVSDVASGGTYAT